MIENKNVNVYLNIDFTVESQVAQNHLNNMNWIIQLSI